MSAESGHLTPLVVGLGNEFRGDDGVGRMVARLLAAALGGSVRVAEESGEGTALMETWRGADLVILIDAVRSGVAPGTIHRLAAHSEPVPSNFFHYSTHAFSIAEAVELARALGQLPPRLIIYGIEGKAFESGTILSPEIQAAAVEVARRIQAELCTNSH